MGLLSDLDILPAYHKGTHDIANDFYLPCMANAERYKRAVAFFKSSVFVIAWPSLIEFMRKSGHISLICSPFLSREDVKAMETGYKAKHERGLGEKMVDEITEMLNDPILAKPTRVLASLIAMGILDIQIAKYSNQASPLNFRLFHNKLGIFMDGEDNKVVFKGSMNETNAGLSLSGNLESIDVFVSWGDERERKRVHDEERFFNNLWRNQFEGIEVVEFPKIAKHELLKYADKAMVSRWAEEITEDIKGSNGDKCLSWTGGRIPYPHQKEAIENWEKIERRGILKHATGSGKTFTAMLAIRDALDKNEIPLILVPSIELMAQWEKELKKSTKDQKVNILKCGSGHNKWREDNLLLKWSRPTEQNKIILSTIQTAAREEFRRMIYTGKHLFIIADEVHRLGSPVHQRIFNIDSGPRLGLSATPERAGDRRGTKAIFNYFEGIVPPPFTLEKAITLGFLTPYFYHIHTTKLTEREQERWDKYSRKIAVSYARHKEENLSDSEIFEKLRLLFINRARITKTASQKPAKALEIINEEFSQGEKWIVYCDSQVQMNQVLDLLTDNGIRSNEYHSNMAGDRNETLNLFKANGGVLVSIRCLDEGIDIPTVTHALILASSKNPREFIQRRGRVLRKAPDKHLSFVHDVLVLPNNNQFKTMRNSNKPPGYAILAGELSRAIIFSKTAQNATAGNKIKNIAIKNNIDIDELKGEGYEND